MPKNQNLDSVQAIISNIFGLVIHLFNQYVYT